MASGDRGDITRILLSLQEATSADPEATRRLFEAAYAELRHIAAALMRGERPGHTLEPTALVNEAYVRLVDGAQVRWQGRAHFFGAAVRAMRRILVDYARERGALKRGGGMERVSLHDDLAASGVNEIEILDLDRALERLAACDARAAQIVEMRVFGGLTIPEVAHLLQVSESTVSDEWSFVKAWVAREFVEGRTR